MDFFFICVNFISHLYVSKAFINTFLAVLGKLLGTVVKKPTRQDKLLCRKTRMTIYVCGKASIWMDQQKSVIQSRTMSVCLFVPKDLVNC